MGFVQEYESADWFQPNSSVVSVTCADGDTLVASAVCGNQLRTLTISGGGLTWTLRGSVSATSRCSIAQWTAQVGVGQGGTFNVTVTYLSGGAGGVNILRYDHIVGVGASTAGDAPDPAAPALTLTTTQGHSIVVVVVGDHATVDGAARVWRTADAGALTEQSYYRSNFNNAAYCGFHADAGAAGAKVVGLTLPNTMRPSIAAVELITTTAQTVLGTAGATLGAVQGTAAGVRVVGGHAAATLGPVAGAASGKRTVFGTGAGSGGAVSGAASGLVIPGAPRSVFVAATDEVVTKAWIAQLPGFSAAMVGEQLPRDRTEWQASGFVTVAVGGGSTVPEFRLESPVMIVQGWAVTPGIDRPPWEKARNLVAQIQGGTYQGPGPSGWLIELPTCGENAVVKTAYAVGKPRRVYGDVGDYAGYVLHVVVNWVPVAKSTP